MHALARLRYSNRAVTLIDVVTIIALVDVEHKHNLWSIHM